MDSMVWMGGSCFSVKIFCLTVPKKFVKEPFCVSKKWFRKFSSIGGGGNHVFVENFLYQRTEKFCKGSLLFQKFSGVDKILCITDGGGRIPFFRRKNRVSKNFMHQNRVGKKLWIRNGWCYFFPSNFFVSQCRKISWENPSMFQKIWGFEKIYAKEGDITILR